MADRCPHCGAANPENLPFCNECGEPIDKNLQLIMEVQQSTQTQHTAEKSRTRYDDDDLFDEDDEDEEDGRKHFVLWAVILLFAAAAVGAWFFLR